MGKPWRRRAGWRQTGGWGRNVQFRNPIQAENAKQHGYCDGIRQGNADMRGRRSKLSVRRFVVVGIVLVRARRIRMVVAVICVIGVVRVTLVNQSGILQQCVR